MSPSTRRSPVEAATVTASYESGRRDVIINGYGTTAMGTFRLDDGSESLLALCIEADVAHSTGPEAYRSVGPMVTSPNLDALLWWLDQLGHVDDDTAVAASALAWYYAGARRSNGPPVWADGSRSFAPITPEAPEPWDALAPFSLSHPVGLIVPGTHLDAVERRVAELHRMVTTLSGTWTVEVVVAPDERTASARLLVDGLPLADRPLTIVVTGATETEQTGRTGATGTFVVDLPPDHDGLRIRASVSAPGPHREWDGDGPVQRLATPTSVEVTGEAVVAPPPGHVVVRKQSPDPTIGVEGATFQLRDATGDVVAAATSDTDGIATFPPVDRAAHPGPYTVVETAAPAGLVVSADAPTVDDLSTDPDAPTVVTITNEPATASLSIRKALDLDGVGPDDRSGFEFEIRRRTDGWRRTATTGADGSTGPIAVPLGTYDICEVTVPAWAAALLDTGCREVDVGLDALDTDLAIEYVNAVPEPTIDTRAGDALDGDQTLTQDHGSPSQVVDRVELGRLVPHTTYRVRGELVDAVEGTPLGAVGWVEFVAVDASAVVEVVIDAEGLAPGRVVVVEEVYVGDTLLARHDDLADADQTVTFEPPPDTTVATTTTTTTSTTVPPATTTTVAPPSTTSPTVPTPPPPSTLPPTGTDAVAAALRLGDVGFVLGVALLAISGLVPARRGAQRDEAER
ncbi:MAG: SpaA isopeptide-forming pilin-related protein [Ilumatobacteraceae bacterium]